MDNLCCICEADLLEGLEFVPYICEDCVLNGFRLVMPEPELYQDVA